MALLDSHPSLSASLDDFEAHEPLSPQSSPRRSGSESPQHLVPNRLSPDRDRDREGRPSPSHTPHYRSPRDPSTRRLAKQENTKRLAGQDYSPPRHSSHSPSPSSIAADSASDARWSPSEWRTSEVDAGTEADVDATDGSGDHGVDTGIASGIGWYRHRPLLHHQLSHAASHKTERLQSRQSSPELSGPEDDDPTLPANIPLPRGSRSPTKEASPSPEEQATGTTAVETQATQELKEIDVTPTQADKPNYFHLTMRADVRHRTESIEAALAWIRRQIDRLTDSKSSLATTLISILLAISLVQVIVQQPTPLPSPDLVNVAGIAGSFEPLLYYSEGGVQHITELQEAGVAVWDLGESVRVANLTNAPVIVRELDALSAALTNLGLELTKFFTLVNGDVDNILLTMDWARRELAALPSAPPPAIVAALGNVHAVLTQAGILADPTTGEPTAAGRLVSSLVGRTPSQRTRHALQRTFEGLLSSLENSISGELTHAATLFALFEGIDLRFRNLQAFTVREFDQQEQLEHELLSSLWARALGGHAQRLRKFERNKTLLRKVRERTVLNKNLLLDHSGKLRGLQHNLELVRRRLVAPLIQGRNGTIASVDDQVRGLAATWDHLSAVRGSQNARWMEALYGSTAGSRRKMREIESVRGQV